MKYIRKGIYVLAFIGIFICILFFANNYIVTDRISINGNGLVDDLKVMHLSDLHNKIIENPFSSFSSKIKKNKPDIILITGDVITSNRDESLKYIEYLKRCFEGIPVFYVNGNHEYSDYAFLNVFNKKMKEYGFVCLDGIGKTISVRGKRIYLAGLRDPNSYEVNIESMISKRIQELESDEKVYKILLSHRAEYTPIYNESNFDLILCGHAHGGVIGIPFTNRGLYATGEGFFPKYVKGLHKKTYISRGLGGSRFFTRLFNHPQISLITIF